MAPRSTLRPPLNKRRDHRISGYFAIGHIPRFTVPRSTPSNRTYNEASAKEPAPSLQTRATHSPDDFGCQTPCYEPRGHPEEHLAQRSALYLPSDMRHDNRISRSLTSGRNSRHLSTVPRSTPDDYMRGQGLIAGRGIPDLLCACHSVRGQQDTHKEDKGSISVMFGALPARGRALRR